MSARTRKQQSDINDADSAAYISHCIELVANLAKQLESLGADPQLHESLKALQLMVDRGIRRMARDEGIQPQHPTLIKLLSAIPESIANAKPARKKQAPRIGHNVR